MLRLILIATALFLVALLLVGWATPSSAEVKGDLYECSTVDAQMLGRDGKLERNDWTKTEIKKFKFMIYDEASGILRFGKVDSQLFGETSSEWVTNAPKEKAHPPIKLKVVKSEESEVNIASIDSRGGRKKTTFQKRLTNFNKPMVRAFYIRRNTISFTSIDGKDQKYEGKPFYFLNNYTIYSGVCNLFELTNASSSNK